ncbi:glycerol-3-phosphate 1-O-acyltransferase PlsY [Verrucomicrobiota bacterium]
MNKILIFIVCASASYLLGAIPFGYIIAQAKGIDIRRVGSGNIGATNVFRTVGKGWGILTFLCDVLKGFIPAFFFPLILERFSMAEGKLALSIVCACFAVAGHNWPVYLRFKGGKGVATSAGALLGVAPVPLIIGLISWLAIFMFTRYVSLASITAALAIPVSGWFLYFKQSSLIPSGILAPALLTLLGLAAVWRHKSNIQRLIRGNEHRFEFGRKNHKV